jgi:hypothetical protein
MGERKSKGKNKGKKLYFRTQNYLSRRKQPDQCRREECYDRDTHSLWPDVVILCCSERLSCLALPMYKISNADARWEGFPGRFLAPAPGLGWPWKTAEPEEKAESESVAEISRVW